MNFLKRSVKILIYLFLIAAFFILAFLEKSILFYGVAIMILLLLVHEIIKNIVKMRKNKEKYIRRIIVLIVDGILFVGVVNITLNYKEYKEEIISFIIEEQIKVIESDEYNQGFEEVNYKNYRILFNENNKEVIKLIESYLDEIEEKNKRLFNIASVSNLTIKFDYDEGVFENRRNISEDTLGYYIIQNKTIYIYVENEDEILNDWNDFKSTFFHEYTHHCIRECLNSNNVSESKMPVWFDEGVAEYMGNTTPMLIKCVDEFIPFSKIENQDTWKEFDNGDNYIQSLYMINKIIDKEGEEAITQLVVNMKKDSFKVSFEKVMGYSLDEFEKEIENDVKNAKEACDDYSELKKLMGYH